jgi:hypothetical protein
MLGVTVNIFDWRKFVMYKSMKILIGKKFYRTAEQAQNKLDVFFACNRLTDEEYEELTVLVGTVYSAEETDSEG